jgi:hypothetical protein
VLQLQQFRRAWLLSAQLLGLYTFCGVALWARHALPVYTTTPRAPCPLVSGFLRGVSPTCMGPMAHEVATLIGVLAFSCYAWALRFDGGCLLVHQLSTNLSAIFGL